MFSITRRRFCSALGKSPNRIGVVHGYVETWRKIGDYWSSGDRVIDQLEVSTAGRVRGPRLDITKGALCKRGYYVVRGAETRLAVHLLVGRTWRGARREEILASVKPETEYLTVQHWNQQLQDNRASNLVWIIKPLHKKEGDPADPHDPRRAAFEEQSSLHVSTTA